MKVAIIGATGLVGRKMRTMLKAHQVPVDELLLAASASSVGIELELDGEYLKVQSIEEVLHAKPDVAIFSAGGSVSKEWALQFAEAGTTVIDNSSAWRMDEQVPLIVPEVNGALLTKSDKIIANPNCSTIQLMMAIFPLHQAYGLKKLVVSTYQSVSGSGNKALLQLFGERKEEEDYTKVYPHKIDLNCLPHCDEFQDNDYTKEELKLLNESRKILGLPQLLVSATAVRVPVIGGHSESVYAAFESEVNPADAKALLQDFKGVVLEDNPADNIYPMPINAYEKDEVFVGRVRQAIGEKNALNLWVVADNIHKGAATNAVQILTHLHQNDLL